MASPLVIYGELSSEADRNGLENPLPIVLAFGLGCQSDELPKLV
jgi:hypothetical protein